MDERRAWPRIAPRKRTTLRVVSTDPPDSQAALICDLSAGGVRLVTARPLAQRALVLLDVPGAEVVGARVEHASEQADGTWVAGCALFGQFNPDDLLRLGSEDQNGMRL